MAVVVNKNTGLAENLPDDVAQQGLQSGSHDVLLNTPEGEQVTASYQDAPGLIARGHSHPTPEQYQGALDYAQYSSPTEQAKTLGEGALKGALPFGAGTSIERTLGADPEAMRKREEVNPGLSATGEVGGFLGSSFIPGVGQAKVLTHVGEAAADAAKVFGLGREGAGILSRLGVSTVKGAAEMAAFQSGDEISKMLKEDPNTSAEQAISNIGASALFGGALGVGSHALGEAVKATGLGQMIEDFKGRLGYHINNPNPTSAVHNELQQQYDVMKNLNDETWGAQGLKAQDVAKAVPPMNDAIANQSGEFSNLLSKQMDEMVAKPYDYSPRLAQKFNADIKNYQTAMTQAKEAGDSAGMFSAAQDLKQQFQSYAKDYKRIPTTSEEYGFVKASKDMAHALKEGLEDKEVWGKAAERQQAINGAFKEYLPALKDFERRFTVEVGGQRVVDPSKVNTYMNQLGKPTAEVKKEMLENYLDASDKYKKVIGDTHTNLGLDAPQLDNSLHMARETLGDKSTGAGLADLFIKKGLSQIAGKSLGAGIGGAIGHTVGLGQIGAYVGTHALGSFLGSALPAMVKPLLGTAASPEGFKAAADYVAHVAKGEAKVNKAVKAIFKAGANVTESYNAPKENDLKKLEERLKAAQTDPSKLMNSSNALAYYFPDHAGAQGAVMARIANYMKSVTPDVAPKAVLDKPRIPTAGEKADYAKALSICQQPISIMKDIQDGTLTPKSMQCLSMVYPNFMESLKQKLFNEMQDKKTQASDIPFKTLQGVSMFLGMPLEASQSPQVLLANNMPPRDGQGPKSAPKGNGPGKHDTKSLNKLSSTYATADQSREQDRIKK